MKYVDSAAKIGLFQFSLSVSITFVDYRRGFTAVFYIVQNGPIVPLYEINTIKVLDTCTVYRKQSPLYQIYNGHWRNIMTVMLNYLNVKITTEQTDFSPLNDIEMTFTRF